MVQKEFEDGGIAIGEYNKELDTFEGLVRYDNEDETGIVYLANFKNSKKNGKGAMQFPNGDLYEGNFVDNEMNGEGTFYFSETCAILKGKVFKGKKIEGKGEFIWKVKGKGVAKFSGEIKDGVPEGKGKEAKNLNF